MKILKSLIAIVVLVASTIVAAAQVSPYKIQTDINTLIASGRPGGYSAADLRTIFGEIVGTSYLSVNPTTGMISYFNGTGFVPFSASNVAGLSYGTTANTVAQGNDSRIVNALQPTSNGSFLGISLFGAPSFASLQKTIADQSAFFSFGGIADGLPHPLSGVTSFNGINTTSYTLAQWQSLFASYADTAGSNPVTALTNEIDEVALQALINYRVGNSAIGQTTISLPSGSLRLTHPIKSGCLPISVIGFGPAQQFSTTILQTVAGQDGWHHGTADTACPSKFFSTFLMRNISLQATGAGGRALDISVSPSSGGVDIRDSSFTGSLASYTTNYWHDGIRCNNCSNSYLVNDTILGSLGGNLSNMGVGLTLTGNGTGQFITYSVNIGDFNTCISATSGSGQDLEGNYFDSLNVNSCNIGFNVAGSFSGMRSPMWFIRNGQWGNIGQTWLNLNYMAEVTVDNNLTYATAPGFTFSATTATGSNLITNISGLPANYAVAIGQAVFGAGIPSSTFIGSVSGVTATLVNGSGIAVNATASGNAVLRSAPSATPTDFVLLNNNLHVNFTNNKMNFGGSVGNYGTAGNYSHNINDVLRNQFNNGVRIRDNFILDYGYIFAGGWVDSSGNVDSLETGTSFTTWNSGTANLAAKVVGANGSGANARYSTFYSSITGGASGGQVHCSLTTTGDVSCTGTVTGSLNSNLELPVSFPTGAFTSSPAYMLANNGDFGVANSACGPEYSSISTSGFTAKCPTSTNGASVRVTWSAVGQ